MSDVYAAEILGAPGPSFADIGRRLGSIGNVTIAPDASDADVMTALRTSIGEVDGEPVADALTALLARLNYGGLHITNFVASPLLAEVGATVDVSLTWATSGTVTAQTINGQPVDPAARGNVYHGVTGTTSYTLAVHDGSAPAGAGGTDDSAVQTVVYKHRRYWGSRTVADLNTTGVVALQNSELSDDRALSVTIDPGTDGEYVYYCYPAFLGDPPSYKLFGFTSTPVRQVVPVTTNAGAQLDYVVLRSAEQIVRPVLVEVA